MDTLLFYTLIVQRLPSELANHLKHIAFWLWWAPVLYRVPTCFMCNDEVLNRLSLEVVHLDLMGCSRA